MANSSRRCPNCKAYNRVDDDGVHFDRRTNRLYCSIDGWIEHCANNVRKLADGHRKKVRVENYRTKKALNDNSRSHQNELTQTEFNRWVRLTQAGDGCISCGTKNPNIQYCAGHYLSRGARGDLRFNEDNVHLQCNKRCNLELSGNALPYRVNLIKKIGIDRVEALELNNSADAKRSIDDIKFIRSKYSALNRELLDRT
jgi:hypothetical protein